MEPKTPRFAEVVPINAKVAELRAARAVAASQPAASAEAPLDEGRMDARRGTNTLNSASILLLRVGSSTPDKRFGTNSMNKGKFFDIGVVEHGTGVKKEIMLIAIDAERREVLLLDWYGKKITLTEGGESVPIGSGKVELRLEHIGTKVMDYKFDRTPTRMIDEVIFMTAHLDTEWEGKYRDIW